MNSVLLVDDDPGAIELLIRYLKPWQCQVDVAFSGAEAVQKLRDSGFRFELVISDMRMPNGTGIDLLREINSSENPVPLILMSAVGKVAEEQAKALGARAFLEKPLDKTALKRLLDQFLQTEKPRSESHFTEITP